MPDTPTSLPARVAKRFSALLKAMKTLYFRLRT